MKQMWTVNDILRETGWSWPFLKQFIPDHLRPTEWNDPPTNKDLDRLLRGNVFFSSEEHDKFIRFLASEFLRNYEILSRMKIIEVVLSDVFHLVYEVNQFFKSFTERMTLAELAKELGYKNVGSLRNKIRIIHENGEKIGILELPGYRFTLHKIKNQWTINRLDFINQTRQLGIDKFLQYFGNHAPIPQDKKNDTK